MTLAKDETSKATLEGTARYAYTAMPHTGEVYQVNLTDFNMIKKIKVSNMPYRLTIFGFEIACSTKLYLPFGSLSEKQR